MATKGAVLLWGNMESLQRDIPSEGISAQLCLGCRLCTLCRAANCSAEYIEEIQRRTTWLFLQNFPLHASPTLLRDSGELNDCAGKSQQLCGGGREAIRDTPEGLCPILYKDTIHTTESGIKNALALVLSPYLQLTYPKATDSSARAVLVLGYQDYQPPFQQQTTKPNCSCCSYGCVLLPCPFVVHTLTCLQ